MEAPHHADDTEPVMIGTATRNGRPLRRPNPRTNGPRASPCYILQVAHVPGVRQTTLVSVYIDNNFVQEIPLHIMKKFSRVADCEYPEYWEDAPPTEHDTTRK